MSFYRVEPTPESTVNVFSAEHGPTVTIDSGDTIVLRSLDAAGCRARGHARGADGVADPGRGMTTEAVVSVAAERPLGTVHAETPALALASTCVDLRVTQVANMTWGVHALLPAGLLS